MSVAAGGAATATFGDQQVGTVSGVVFNDPNGSGTQDAGELGIGGVTVQLKSGAVVVASTTTAGDGSYTFTSVTPGSYTVVETDPSGYVSTTSNAVPVSVAAGGAATANFGDQQVGTVSGVVFNDPNGNGVQDAGELGIGGVTVQLKTGAVVVATTTTAGDGSYSFTSVTPGSYTVQETDPSGYVSTMSNTVAVSVAPGGAATATFGDQQVGTVSGTVFNDPNGNGTQDPGELGIGGVTVQLKSGSTVVASTTTAGDGSYTFTSVTPGSYTVQETDPSGYVSTTNNTVPVSVAAGGAATATFGDQQVGTVSGVVFNDPNGNGTQDPGELGIGGVTVQLKSGSTVVASTTTAGDGSYSFTSVTPGSYTVQETDPSGYVSTTSNTVPVSVAPGGAATANFGDQLVAPHLTLAKSDTPDPVPAGGQIVYTIQFGNTGSADATGVVITDGVPVGTTFVSATGGGTYNGGTNTVTWNIGTVAAGTSGSVSLTVQVGLGVPNGTVIVNTASMTASNASAPPNTVASTVAVAPVLTFQKTDTPDPVRAGGQIVYTISFSNTGNGDATGVVITDVVPANATFVSATGGGTYNGGTNTVTWNIGTVAAGTSGSVSLTVQVGLGVPNGTVIVNTASMAASNASAPPNTVASTVAVAPVLTFQKSATPDPVQAGGQLVYTISFSNTGNGDATSVDITDAVPANTSFVSATGGYTYNAGTGTVTWNISTLAAGTSGSVSLTVQVASPLPNGLVIADTALLTSAETGSRSASASAGVSAAPVLTIAKTGTPDPVPAGSQIVYTIAYRNPGSENATGVVITDTVPGNTSFVSATGGGTYNAGTNTITWNIATLAAGLSGSVALTVQVASPLANGTQITNVAAIDSNETAPQSAQAQTLVTSAPVLTITKAGTPDPVQAGGQIVYTIDYQNTGNADATGVVITDTVPGNTSFVAASGGGIYNAGTNTVTWTIGTLAAGSSGSASLTVQVASPLANGTQITNVAGIDSNETAPQSSQAQTLVTSAPVLMITKSGTPDPVQAGGQIVYTIAYRNTGNANATGAVITDTVPGNTSFVSTTSGGVYNAGTNTVTWSLGTLGAGSSGSLSLVVQVGSGTPDGTVVTNTAAITSNETPPQTALAQTTVSAAAVPVLTLTKAGAPDPVQAGGQIIYTIGYQNTGSASATGVVITDTLPANTSFVSATGGGIYNAGTNTVTWSLGTLAAGPVRILHAHRSGRGCGPHRLRSSRTPTYRWPPTRRRHRRHRRRLSDRQLAFTGPVLLTLYSRC